MNSPSVLSSANHTWDDAIVSWNNSENDRDLILPFGHATEYH